MGTALGKGTRTGTYVIRPDVEPLTDVEWRAVTLPLIGKHNVESMAYRDEHFQCLRDALSYVIGSVVSEAVSAPQLPTERVVAAELSTIAMGAMDFVELLLGGGGASAPASDARGEALLQLLRSNPALLETARKSALAIGKMAAQKATYLDESASRRGRRGDIANAAAFQLFDGLTVHFRRAGLPVHVGSDGDANLDLQPFLNVARAALTIARDRSEQVGAGLGRPFNHFLENTDRSLAGSIRKYRERSPRRSNTGK